MSLSAQHPGPLLHSGKVPPPERRRAVTETLKDYPGHFATEDAARHFLMQIILPPSGRWAFISTGKNASSSVLRFLFRAEFGTDLTASYDSALDINPAAVVHQLAEHDVFSRATLLGLSARRICEARDIARLCVVREPGARARSAFRYLCRSDAEARAWFLGDRLRMDAAGFDWRTMPGTLEGYRRFLHYIEAEIARVGAGEVNGHWRPQVDFICPEVFRPTLTGRMEALPAFFAELAARLDVAPPEVIPWENRQDATPDLAQDAEARRLVERIFARDFEVFGY
jgi:hypothetical protein